MTHRADALRHRLDDQQTKALACDDGEVIEHPGAPIPLRLRRKAVAAMARPQRPRVLLRWRPSGRTSARGDAYVAGRSGRACLVDFRGEPDAHDNRIRDAAEPEPRNHDRKAARPASGRAFSSRTRRISP